MQIEVLPDGEAASLRGAKVIAAAARASVTARRPVSDGGQRGEEPVEDVLRFSQEDVPWEKVEIIQVDERVAPDEIRTATSLTFAKACWDMRRCVRNKSTPCPLPIPISKRPRDAMPD